MREVIYKYYFWVMSFFLLSAVLIIITGCQGNTPDEVDISRVSEIAKLFDNVPIHPGKALKQADNETDSNDTSIVKTFQSDAAFDEVREFYLTQLPQAGWQFIEERELKDKGRLRGERILEFQKGEFALSVQFAGDRREILGWSYAVRIAYPENNRKKI